MPIYEYLCEACEAHLDLLQKINAPTPSVCQSCGAQNTLKKRISVSAFHLKGGGWYSDLYASHSSKPSQGTASETPTPEAKKTEAKTETPSSPCAGCPAASSSACASAQKP
jgi:putative FmdB family regulatory protein